MSFYLNMFFGASYIYYFGFPDNIEQVLSTSLDDYPEDMICFIRNNKDSFDLQEDGDDLNVYYKGCRILHVENQYVKDRFWCYTSFYNYVSFYDSNGLFLHDSELSGNIKQRINKVVAMQRENRILQTGNSKVMFQTVSENLSGGLECVNRAMITFDRERGLEIEQINSEGTIQMDYKVNLENVCLGILDENPSIRMLRISIPLFD